MIYTTDFHEDRVLAKRLGYRLPRKILLPPYLGFNPFFYEWMDATDELFDSRVEDKIEVIKNLRNMWVENPEVERKIQEGEMLSQRDWSVPEQAIVLKQLNMLGLQLGVPTVMFDEYSFMNFCRFIGLYWMQKGTGTFMDFVNFCTGMQFKIINCWTKDYKEFYAEDDTEHVGTPIWEGGEWYPTTHIIFKSINPEFTDVKMLGQLFYELANYNLVLYSIDCVFNLQFQVPGSDDVGLRLQIPCAKHMSMVIPTEGYSVPEYVYDTLLRVISKTE